MRGVRVREALIVETNMAGLVERARGGCVTSGELFGIYMGARSRRRVSRTRRLGDSILMQRDNLSIANHRVASSLKSRNTNSRRWVKAGQEGRRENDLHFVR